MSNRKLPLLNSLEEYCDFYFKNYNKDHNYRQAWLKLKEIHFKQIRDNHFFLDENAEIFKNEILKFWELGYSYRNSKIRKKTGGWIPFQDNDGQTVDGGEIVKELEADNLELHGNYSWSMMFMGGDITVDMQRLKNTLDYLFDESIAIEERFFKVVNKDGKYKIKGMSHGKASAFLHIRYPNDYGVWNSCTKKAFKILSEVDSKFNIRRAMREADIRGNNIGEKYRIINERLKLLLEKFKKKDENSSYGFKNLSDVDIFVWYVANNF